MLSSATYAGLVCSPGRLNEVSASRLPVAACGVLGRQLQAVPAMAALRAAIAARLRRTITPQWIKTTDLALVALALDGLQASAPQQVTGNDLALFAMRLMESEIAVGGPYRRTASTDTTDDTDRTATIADPFTNACIAQCLDWMAALLPNVLDCVTAAIPGIADIDVTDWALFVAVCQPARRLRRPSVMADIAGHLDIIGAGVCAQILQRAAVHGGLQTADSSLAQHVHRHCMSSLPRFVEPFNTNTRTMLEQVISVDTNHEISQLAWYYGRALGLADDEAVTVGGVSGQTAVSARTYVQLGTANIYAWAAYTIYDDFLDDEGQPTMLGTANYAFRAMIRNYRRAVPDNQAFQRFVEQVLTIVDQANTLETTHFRLPVHGRNLTIASLPEFGGCDLLADRALFHILGPMAVLASSGRVVIGDDAWKHTLQALRHYLICRQLNDDIHDWAKDLQAGQATYVVVELLRHLGLRPGTYDLDQLLPRSRELFWQDVLPQICDRALQHVATARRHLEHGPELSAHPAFIGLFDYVEGSMRDAQRKRDQSRTLLQTLRQAV